MNLLYDDCPKDLATLVLKLGIFETEVRRDDWGGCFSRMLWVTRVNGRGS